MQYSLLYILFKKSGSVFSITSPEKKIAEIKFFIVCSVDKLNSITLIQTEILIRDAIQTIYISKRIHPLQDVNAYGTVWYKRVSDSYIYMYGPIKSP